MCDIYIRYQKRSCNVNENESLKKEIREDKYNI
jgi:hypothetical protein